MFKNFQGFGEESEGMPFIQIDVSDMDKKIDYPEVLPVVPFGLHRMAVEPVRVVEVFIGAELPVKGLQVLLNKGEGHPARDDELDMLLEEGVDVVLAVKASVHDQLDFGVPEDVQFRQKKLDRLHVGDVSGQLAVVKREA